MILNPPAQPAKGAAVIQSQLQMRSRILWEETLNTDRFAQSLYLKKKNTEMAERLTASSYSMALSDKFFLWQVLQAYLSCK